MPFRTATGKMPVAPVLPTQGRRSVPDRQLDALAAIGEINRDDLGDALGAKRGEVVFLVNLADRRGGERLEIVRVGIGRLHLDAGRD